MTINKKGFSRIHISWNLIFCTLFRRSCPDPKDHIHINICSVLNKQIKDTSEYFIEFNHGGFDKITKGTKPTYYNREN